MFRGAFTLIELLIVLIILGLLAAAAIPQFSEAATDSKLSALQQNLADIRKQLEIYKLEHDGRYPDAPALFEIQMTQQTNVDGTWVGSPELGPYLLYVPDNPFATGKDRNRVTATPSAPHKAWYFNVGTGEFRANDGGTTNGIPHNSL